MRKFEIKKFFSKLRSIITQEFSNTFPNDKCKTGRFHILDNLFFNDQIPMGHIAHLSDLAHDAVNLL